MALAVNSNFSSRPTYYSQEGQPAETRPFSYLTRPANTRVPYVIQDQPCVDSDIYFGPPSGRHPGVERPPPRPPRSPKVSRFTPDKPPRTPPRSPLVGRAHMSYTQSDSDLRSHVGLRVPQPGTPPPRTPPALFGSGQMFFPSDDHPPPRSPRIPPRSYHAPDSPAVPPRSPRLPPKPNKSSQPPPPPHLQPQLPVARSISNRSDRQDRGQSSNPRTDVQKMTRQTSADTVRITAQTERELRAAPPPPVSTPVITEQPRSTKRSANVDDRNGGRQPKGQKKQGDNKAGNKKSDDRKTGDRQEMEMEKSEERKGCCQHCAKVCVNDIPEFLIELCLD